MPDVSDEQTWWSNLFTGGADTGLEIPDGLWESVVAATFESETQPPADELLPTDHGDNGFDALDDEPAGHFEEATHHGSADHEVPYDADPDDAGFDGDDAGDDDF